MTETKTPPTPSPTPGVSGQIAVSQSGKSPRSDFMAAVLGMSWQLALVVLVPIVGGFELDRQFATSPLLVMLGFVVAMIGFGLVVRQQLHRFSPPEVTQPVKSAKSQASKIITPQEPSK
jgi:uncharacterized membrane protein YhaH (DUF805 family)